MNLDMPIQIKNSEIIKQKKNKQNKKGIRYWVIFLLEI